MIRWCVAQKKHAGQCFQHFAVLTVGMRFCDFCAFSGSVFCHCSGWNEVTAMWSYLEKCHARQCFQHFACFLGGWSVQGATGLQWFKFRALGLRRDHTVLVAKGMDACDRFSCYKSLCSMLYKEAKSL